jgi:16S rRNA processing protein RimM
MLTDLNEWIEIGRIVSPQGLHGEVRVYPDSDFPERFMTPGERWMLRPGAKELESVTLQTGRFLDGKGLYVLRFAEFVSIDQAEMLRGTKLMVPVGDRPPLAENEFHVLDLVGMTVVDGNTQAIIGTVIGIANAFVKSLNLQTRQIELLPIPGLIPDLSEIAQKEITKSGQKIN